jgi:hypothetical protein
MTKVFELRGAPGCGDIGMAAFRGECAISWPKPELAPVIKHSGVGGGVIAEACRRDVGRVEWY